MLWVLLAVPVLAALLVWSQVRRQQALARFASPAGLQRLGVTLPGWRAWVRPILGLLAVTGVVFATARPQWGWEDRRIVSRGVDLMIAIDTSTSMLAQDYKPSRLERAKELLQNIVWEAKGDRIGVMAFAGNAVVLCPLTLDYSMANTALESVDTKTVQAQGTAIGVAIDAATKAFETGGAGERVLVLLTDGEDQGTQPMEAAKRAQTAKVKIFCIGIGSTQGTLIPLGGGYKQDQEGHPVNSRLDFQTLTDIAQLTSGRAMKANFSGAAEVTSILGELNQLKGVNQQDRIYRVYKERYPWFLVPAILLLLLEAFGVGAPRRRALLPGARVHGATAALLLLFAMMLLPTAAVAYPGEAKVLSDRALKEYQDGQFAKAAQDFAEAATKAGDNALTKFNLGAARYKAGETNKAEDTFKSVFDPQHPEVNAAAEYNVGVLEHKEARKELEAKKQDWEQSIGKGDEKVMDDMKKSIAKLETATNRYKSAILKAPDDHDMKVNYEIARRDLDELKKLLEKQQPPPTPQQQQQQQQQQQDKKQQPQQGNKSPDQQQGKQDDQKNQKDQKDQQNKQDQNQQQKEQQNKDQGQQRQDQAKGDQQKKDQEKNQGKPDQDQQQQDQEEQAQKDQQQKQQQAKATPTPQPGNKEQSKAGGGANGKETDKEAEEEQVAIGEMSKSDVDRLLNSLPPENNKALQKFLNANYKTRENMDKDW
jgi:Ca-activated chloride channel family protein